METMRSRAARALVSLVLALAVPLPALAACGSALVQPASHRMCGMAQPDHCEHAQGLAPDCCKVDEHTARHQVVQTVAPVPGKSVLALLPASAQPSFDVRSTSGRSLRAPLLEPPLDVSHLRSVVLLI